MNNGDSQRPAHPATHPQCHPIGGASAYKSTVESPKSEVPKPRGARFHALRLAKWMLSVMRFLCKFLPEKKSHSHTDWQSSPANSLMIFRCHGHGQLSARQTSSSNKWVTVQRPYILGPLALSIEQTNSSLRWIADRQVAIFTYSKSASTIRRKGIKPKPYLGTSSSLLIHKNENKSYLKPGTDASFIH